MIKKEDIKIGDLIKFIDYNCHSDDYGIIISLNPFQIYWLREDYLVNDDIFGLKCFEKLL